jgi:hypothetical protein
MSALVFIPFCKKAEDSPLGHADSIDISLDNTAWPIKWPEPSLSTAYCGAEGYRKLKLVDRLLCVSAHSKTNFLFLTSTNSSATCTYIDPFRLARMLLCVRQEVRIVISSCGGYRFAQEFKKAMKLYSGKDYTVIATKKDPISEFDGMMNLIAWEEV